MGVSLTTINVIKPYNGSTPQEIGVNDSLSEKCDKATRGANVVKEDLGPKGRYSDALKYFYSTLKMIDPADPKLTPDEKKEAAEATADVMTKMVYFFWWDAGDPWRAAYYGKKVTNNPYASVGNLGGKNPAQDKAYQVSYDLFDIKKYYYSGIKPYYTSTHVTQRSLKPVEGATWEKKEADISEFGAYSVFNLPGSDHNIKIDWSNKNYGNSLNVDAVLIPEAITGVPDEVVGKSYPLLYAGPVNTFTLSYNFSTNFVYQGRFFDILHGFVNKATFGLDCTHTSTDLTEYQYTDIYKSTGDFYQSKTVQHPFESNKKGMSASIETFHLKIGPLKKYMQCWDVIFPIFNYRSEDLYRNADSMYSYISPYATRRYSSLAANIRSVELRLTTPRIPFRDDASGITLSFKCQNETNPIVNLNGGIVPDDPDGNKEMSSWHLGLDYSRPLGGKNATLQNESFLTFSGQFGNTDTANAAGWTKQPFYATLRTTYKKGPFEWSLWYSQSSNGQDGTMKYEQMDKNNNGTGIFLPKSSYLATSWGTNISIKF